MKHLNPKSVRRGIMAVRAEDDPAAYLKVLNTAFADFKKRHTDDLKGIRSDIEELAMRYGSRGLNGNSSESGGDRTQVNAAFRDYIRGGNTEGLTALSANAAMSVGSDPDGGYTVYPTVSTGITARIFESSPLRAYARIVTISSDTFEELLDLEEADATWVGETAARPATGTPHLGKFTVPAHEIYAMPKITQKLLDDSSIDLAG